MSRGYMSQRVHVLGGKCPGVYVLGVSVQGVHVWGGLCPRTADNNTHNYVESTCSQKVTSSYQFSLWFGGIYYIMLYGVLSYV